MKKIYYTFIFAVIFCICCCFVDLSVVNASEAIVSTTIDNDFAPKDGGDGDSSQSDETQTTTQAQMNMKTYFQNLYEFSPKNLYDTCSFVSLVQYLSYLDTFYNDEIIPEEYERKNEEATTLEGALSSSPGVYRQTTEEEELSFYDYVQASYQTDYQMRLVHAYNEGIENNTVENYVNALSMSDLHELLTSASFHDSLFIGLSYASCYKPRTILQNVSSMDLPKKISPYGSLARDFFYEYVREILDDGLPVLIHYERITDEGVENHAVVAYYCDEDDRIHANMGWGQEFTDTILDSSYYIYAAGSLAFILNDEEFDYLSFNDDNNYFETHSDNYIIDGVGYCGCGKCSLVDISFKDEGGFDFSGTNPSEQPMTYICKTENVTLLTPTRTGYAFRGWYDNVDCLGSPITTIPAKWYNEGELILYAKWAPTYNITFLDEGGGTFSGQLSSEQATSHIYGTSTMLFSPTRQNYAFGGWYLTPNCSSGTRVTALSAYDYTDDITLYANWILTSVEIDVETPWGSGTYNTYTHENVTVMAPTTYVESSGIFHVKILNYEDVNITNCGDNVVDTYIFRIEIRLSRTATLTADSGTFTSEDNITWIWVGQADSVEISTSRMCNVEYLRVDLAY